MIERIKLAIMALFGAGLPVNSAPVNHRGFTSVPDMAAEYAHMWSLIEEIHQRGDGHEVNELISTYMGGSMTNLEMFRELYDMLEIEVDWVNEEIQLTLYGTGKTTYVNSLS